MSRLVVLLMCLSACSPVTQLIPDGHYQIQLTQSRNLFGQNVVHVTRCHVADMKHGFCNDSDIRQSEQMETIAAPGAQIVSSAILGASILGGTALLMHGMQSRAVSQSAAPVTSQPTQVGIPCYGAHPSCATLRALP